MIMYGKFLQGYLFILLCLFVHVVLYIYNNKNIVRSSMTDFDWVVRIIDTLMWYKHII